MRIWYVNHYAVPREVALGWRSQYVARALSQAGHEVTVWAARRHHILERPCGEIPFEFSRDPDGYDFRAVETPAYAGNGPGRLLNVLAFSRAMGRELKAALAGEAAPEIIVVSSPHPWAWSRLRGQGRGRIKMVYEERDIWPEALTDIVGLPAWHPLAAWLKVMVGRIYRQADALISLISGSEDFLRRRGLRPGRFIHIPNGADPDFFTTPSTAAPPAEHLAALASAKAAGKTIVIYAGSMGPPNGLESLLQLAAIPGPKPYHIFLMGDGISRAGLQAEAEAAGLDYLTFLPQTRREQSWAVIKAADAAYHSFKDAPIYRYGISPNKIFDYFMLGKPVVSATWSDKNPVTVSGGGLEVPPGEPYALDRAFRALAAKSETELRAIGGQGRDYVLKHHNWNDLGSKYARVLERVAASRLPADESA
jgi:glycosyltransferase involved in cell wall biosynthesis